MGPLAPRARSALQSSAKAASERMLPCRLRWRSCATLAVAWEAEATHAPTRARAEQCWIASLVS